MDAQGLYLDIAGYALLGVIAALFFAAIAPAPRTPPKPPEKTEDD